jgi:hypothetical protein
MQLVTRVLKHVVNLLLNCKGPDLKQFQCPR